MSPLMVSAAAVQSQALGEGPELAVVPKATNPPAAHAPQPVGLSLKQAQRLLKPRLARSLPALFRQLTGVDLRIWWHPAGQPLSANALARVCAQAPGVPTQDHLEPCQDCQPQCWVKEWASFRSEGCFLNEGGLVNFYTCLRLGEAPVVSLLVLHPQPGSPGAKSNFGRAIQLVRLVFHDLEATLQAAELTRELEGLKGRLPPPLPLPLPALRAHSRSARSQAKARPRAGRSRRGRPLGAPPRRVLRAVEAAASAGAAAPATHNLRGQHRQQLVQRMLEYIHANYSHPVQLHDLAAAMHLNASYVSWLFSTTLDVTFHQYLQEFRLARAKELLRDPVKRISEVAYSVGYSSPNHFRNAFATAVGVPPSTWRETPEAN